MVGISKLTGKSCTVDMCRLGARPEFFPLAAPWACVKAGDM